jgi:hypothetical protein
MPNIPTDPNGAWRMEVTDDLAGWASNALRYRTREDAMDAGAELANRWFAVKAYRAVPSDHPQREAFDAREEGIVIL